MADKFPEEQPSDEQHPTAAVTLEDAHGDPNYAGASPPSAKTRKKRARKTGIAKDKNSAELAGRGQTSLESFARPPKVHDATEETVRDGDDLVAASLDEDPNQDRRKRQKTCSPVPTLHPLAAARGLVDLDWHRQFQVEAGQSCLETIDGPHGTSSMDSNAPVATREFESLSKVQDPVTAPCMDTTTASLELASPDVQSITPKKQIKVTKSGKLVSSPSKALLELPKKRRGRPRTKAIIAPTVTVIRYGQASRSQSRSDFGQKIEDILNGPRRPGRRATKIKVAPTKPSGPPKAPHPFFIGKTDELPVKLTTQPHPPTPRKSACTPGKLRSETRREQSPEDRLTFGLNARSGRGPQQSGLNEAAWPTKETAHVRNLGGTGYMHHHHNAHAHLALRPRKMKHAVIQLSPEEELVARVARDLSGDLQKASNRYTSGFETPESVRLPKRLLTSGTEIARRVCEQVLAPLGNQGVQDLPHDIHPAIFSLFLGIKDTLTPFDEGRCESQTWSQKYSPQSTSHMLHNAGEASALKTWLQSLTVMAVGGALKSSVLSNVKQPTRKKRKKAIDDFIVSDDEDEDEELIEIPNPDVMPHLRSFKQSVWTRSKNVILISGPHGCGKSALVHAVAKELGFEVFEINAGVRRAGKDIQDKVGDMTANHLVNHKRDAAPVKEETMQADVTADEQFDSELRDDITSGRQGMMTSFFQAKPVTKAKPAPKPKVPVSKLHAAKKGTVSAGQAILPMIAGARKSQKQSLIFFEEADILFEEDQQFWTQVTKLAMLSKRPIVISCNDESQIPSQDLPLAAVLRLQPPPVDLATDYLLVLAAREGHILERKAIEDLYNSKKHDLRASINELDFWCQMSVGDRKGGLEWMYQRWPLGKDRDKHGDLLRVASEGTYQSGMGWLSYNVLETPASAAFNKEEELLKQVWADWGISPNEWTAPTCSSPQNSTSPSPTQRSNLGMLSRLDNFVDSLSAADVYSRIGLPTYPHSHCEPTDASLPPISDKTRLNYTISAPLIQVDPRTDLLSFDTSLYIQSRLLLHRAYPDFTPPSPSPPSVATAMKYSQAILLSQNKPAHDALLTRADFASALDVLASPPDSQLPERMSYNLSLSSFDRTFSIITLDLAPYVRSIIAHEQMLETKRARIVKLLGQGQGQATKRARTTRAARTALEGGVRESKRRDRWFEGNLEYERVMGTAGRDWAGMGWRGEAEGGVDTGSMAGMCDGTHSDGDVDDDDDDGDRDILGT